MKSSAPIVTIDGPSGSGKGTISRAVARHAGWRLLDSGALYRLVALAGLELGLRADDVANHVKAARNMSVTFATDLADERIGLNGRDVTSEVRSEVAGQGASRVAAWPEVR
jgi:cytidylate kinase